mgnify:CR=1 FL=1
MRPESSPDHLSLQIVLPGKGLIAFGAGPRCVDADRVKAPSVAAHCGFLVEDAEAAFLAGAILPELTVDFGGRQARNQRLAASTHHGRLFIRISVRRCVHHLSNRRGTRRPLSS